MSAYPSTYPAKAREHFEAGWTNCTEIARKLERELGRRPGQSTVRRWVDPDYAEVVRMRQRRGGVCGPSRRTTASMRLDRLASLTGLGLSLADVAKVANFDFGTSLTGSDVEFLLGAEFSDRDLKRLLPTLFRRHQRPTRKAQ
jgi:hypothetical protein